MRFQLAAELTASRSVGIPDGDVWEMNPENPKGSGGGREQSITDAAHRSIAPVPL